MCVYIYIHTYYIYIYTDTKNGRYGRRPSIPRRYDFVFCANIVGLGCWAVQGTMVFWGTPMVFWWLKPVETTTALAKQPCCLQHGTCLPVFFVGKTAGKPHSFKLSGEMCIVYGSKWPNIIRCIRDRQWQAHPELSWTTMQVRTITAAILGFIQCNTVYLKKRRNPRIVTWILAISSKLCWIFFWRHSGKCPAGVEGPIWWLSDQCPFLEQHRRDLRSGYLPRISRGNEKPPVFKIEWDSGIFDRIPIRLLGCLPNNQVLSSVP